MSKSSTGSKQRDVPLQADVLLVTVTEIEGRAVFDWFRHNLDRAFIPHHMGDKTYFDLGVICGARIMMVQTEMGAGGPGGALMVVDEAIRELSPSAVIMVGIAFGFDQGKQPVGTILVSRQLLGYDLQRVGKGPDGQLEILLRGDRPQASTRLLDRFRGGNFTWTGQKVDFGLILSGEKLIDHINYRDHLHMLAREAIGGEMEGTGLYSAAQRRKVDWILVKAICDWADGNKSKEKDAHQKLAAENAVAFTMHILQLEGFVEESADASTSSNATGNTSPIAPGTTLLTYDTHANYIVAVAWDAQGSWLASAGGDGTIQVWEAETGHLLQTYRGHPWRLAKVNWPPTIHTIAWSPEGLRIVSAGDGASIFIWNATTGQTLALYQGHTGILPNVYAVSWSPDGKCIASACSSTGWDKTIHIWDAASGELVKRLDVVYGLLNFSVLSLAWSPDGTRIAAVCGDKTLRIWHATSGQPLSTYQTGSASVYQLIWSPDSQKIATAHADNLARIWDTQTGKIDLTYRGHTDRVRFIAWSPDGSSLVTASNDRTAQVWDARTGNRLCQYRGHTDWVTSVAWSPDSSHIASGSNDKTVQIWQAK